MSSRRRAIRWSRSWAGSATGPATGIGPSPRPLGSAGLGARPARPHHAVADPLRMVADLDPGDLALAAVGDRAQAVGPAPGDEAVVAVLAVRRPVRLLTRLDQPVVEGRA